MEFVAQDEAKQGENGPASPITRLLYRARHEGLKVVAGPPSKIAEGAEAQIGTAQLLPGDFHADIAEFSPTGSRLALVNIAQGVLTVIDVPNQQVLMQTEHAQIQAVSFSPTGTFLLTWNRPNKETNAHNLIVWDVATGSTHASFFQKAFKRELWPTLQWYPDESAMLKIVSGELVVLDNQGSTLSRHPMPGLAKMAVAPAGRPGEVAVATFFPEAKGKPARVAVYQEGAFGAPLAAKSFFQASECDFLWNSRGTHCIAKTHADVDATGGSYYGSSSMYLLAADGTFDCQIPQRKEGPVGDVAWSPQGGAFCVTAGRMPAAATLFNTRCEPVFEFGEAHRNTVSWSPHGRFLCLAGFGNLAGGMDFWDVNKKKKMGTGEASCAVTYSWSPDSRYFLTATLTPRMNVDNGLKIFKYNGAGPVIEKSIDQLWQCQFAPAPPGAFPDRPQSPPRKGGDPRLSPTPEPKKVGAYRPPNSTGALAAAMRAEREGAGAGKPKPGAYRPPGLRAAGGGGGIPGAGPPGMPVGAAPEPKKKSRRSKKKKAAAGEDGAGGEDGGEVAETVPAAGRGLEEKSGGGEGAGATGAQQQQQQPEAASKEKKLKNLRKRLKQIEALKEKQAAGERMNSDQVAKLGTEAATLAEIAQLNADV